MNPASGTTNSSGQVTSVYISSATSGWCKITATEGATSGSGSATLDQLTSPAPANYKVAVVTFGGSVPADGSSTTTASTNVKDNTSTTNISGDAVRFTKAAGAGCAGVLLNGGSSAVAITDSNGNASVTYTAGTAVGVGVCTITATEANTAQLNSGAETQTAVPNTITVAANPASIPADGTSSSTITITVIKSDGTPANLDALTIGKSGTPGAACGTVPTGAAAATTNANGQATVVYIASTTTGFCTITVTDATGGSGSVIITQHA
jgi:adhesin/invasin